MPPKNGVIVPTDGDYYSTEIIGLPSDPGTKTMKLSAVQSGNSVIFTLVFAVPDSLITVSNPVPGETKFDFITGSQQVETFFNAGNNHIYIQEDGVVYNFQLDFDLKGKIGGAGNSIETTHIRQTPKRKRERIVAYKKKQSPARGKKK